jgi:hypothetical protein
VYIYIYHRMIVTEMMVMNSTPWLILTNSKFQMHHIYLDFYSPLLDLGRFFSFLIFHTVGRTRWVGDQPVTRLLPAHRTTQIQNKRTQLSMLQVEFEPTIPVFERMKTVHTLDRAPIVISVMHHILYLNNLSTNQLIQHE